MEDLIYKDAVIIGNGPSAITLSYMLAGNWPYYNGLQHPIDFLQYKLEENKEKSLLQQDLAYLSEGLEGRSVNPVSVLFDSLVRPQADFGEENASVISWRRTSSAGIDHVVLGRGAPGGSWQKMEPSTLTISLSTWMELPNLSIKQWYSTKNRRCSVQTGLRQNRATVGTVARYYSSYVKSQGLQSYFVNNAVVSSVSFSPQNSRFLWKVDGCIEESEFHTPNASKRPFSYISPNLVLATGNSDQPNRLNVDGEDLPFVLYSLADFENGLKEKGVPRCGHLLVVGAGLSAADAIITARFYGIPVTHVFRRSVYDPDLIFNKIPQDIYPEYHKVHQMMKDSNHTHYEGYKGFARSTIHSIRQDGSVFISSCDNGNVVSTVKVSHVLVLIGRHPDLGFLPSDCLNLGINPDRPVDCKKNPIDIDQFTHESVFCPGLYAVGPLVGDNFVRFVQGGCLASASHIVSNVNNGM